MLVFLLIYQYRPMLSNSTDYLQVMLTIQNLFIKIIIEISYFYFCYFVASKKCSKADSSKDLTAADCQGMYVCCIVGMCIIQYNSTVHQWLVGVVHKEINLKSSSQILNSRGPKSIC